MTALLNWWRPGMAGLLIVGMMLPWLAAPAPVAAETLALDTLPTTLTQLYFPATGQHVSGQFLRWWWEHGQLTIFGFPISDEIFEHGRRVQYFERARFELFSEYEGTPYVVQLGHLGRLVSAGRSEAAFARITPVADGPNREYIENTGHAITDDFKRFWEANDGLYNFGYPLSEAFVEQGRRVQYFERARFELFPEHRGTPYLVQLGHLGRQIAASRHVPLDRTTRVPEATVWTASLASELARQELERQRQLWLNAPVTAIEPYQAVVTVASAHVRKAPTTIAASIRRTYARHLVRITGRASGEPIGGNDRWYRIEPDGGFISATVVAAFTPPTPPRTWTGRWIDVNLSHFYITGYENTTPRYSAIVTAGRESRTPLGVFTIQRRVRNETMDSATVGIPPGHPEYYYLENVLYTQYFRAGGFAIHGNYWVHPSRFGRFSSNGCIGLMNGDAAWFWDFATIGTPVHIHY